MRPARLREFRGNNQEGRIVRRKKYKKETAVHPVRHRVFIMTFQSTNIAPHINPGQRELRPGKYDHNTCSYLHFSDMLSDIVYNINIYLFSALSTCVLCNIVLLRQKPKIKRNELKKMIKGLRHTNNKIPINYYTLIVVHYTHT